MRVRIPLPLALLSVLVVAGCGDKPSDDPTLTISQVFEPAQPFGPEGTATEIVVRFPNGGGVAVKPQPSKMQRTELLATPVAPGSYQIVARQRDCGGIPCSE